MVFSRNHKAVTGKKWAMIQKSQGNLVLEDQMTFQVSGNDLTEPAVCNSLLMARRHSSGPQFQAVWWLSQLDNQMCNPRPRVGIR